MKFAEWPAKRGVKIVAGILLAFFLFYLAVGFYFKAFYGFAWDYSINWTAATALREGVSLYDRNALHQLALREIGSGAQALFNGRFTSYVGLPTTAIAHLPFSYLSFDASVLCYRILSLGAMLATILLTGLVVPPALRWRAWLVGLLCLLLWDAFSFSLKLGQVDAWVMLSLAATLLAFSRAAHKTAGAALAIAVLLKISPGWLLLYCVLKRQWMVVIAAAVVVALGLLLSLLPQHGEDLRVFLTTVLPSLGDSPLHVQNQSLGAWLARMATPDTQLLSFATGIGIWKYVASAVAFMLMLALYGRTRHALPQAEEFAVMILLALIAGPLTWDHYLTWAVIPVMIFAARMSARGVCAVLILLLPMAYPVFYTKPDLIAASYWWRVLTGTQVFSILVLAMWMIRCAGVPAKSGSCNMDNL